MAVDTTIQVVMPKMGDSVAEGTVLGWRKAEGDRVAADETIVDISTDKVDAEVVAPASGTLVKVHAAEGASVSVGAVLAEIVPTNGSDPVAIVDPAPGAQPEPPPTTIVDIVTPKAGESVSEGTILAWTVAVGDGVKAGQTVVEISTDKVDVELPAPASGMISELLANAGDTVTVGQVIGRIAAGEVVLDTTDAEIAPAAREAAEDRPAASDGAAASPVARRAADAHSVDLTTVAGSGPRGRITKADVLDAAAQPAAKAAAASATAIKGGAAMLVHYMEESRKIPTATSFRTLAVGTLDARRGQLKQAGKKVSFTHLIAFAIARAAAALPVMTQHFAKSTRSLTDRRRRRQPRPRRRRRAQRRIAHADGPGRA